MPRDAASRGGVLPACSSSTSNRPRSGAPVRFPASVDDHITHRSAQSSIRMPSFQPSAMTERTPGTWCWTTQPAAHGALAVGLISEAQQTASGASVDVSTMPLDDGGTHHRRPPGLNGQPTHAPVCGCLSAVAPGRRDEHRPLRNRLTHQAGGPPTATDARQDAPSMSPPTPPSCPTESGAWNAPGRTQAGCPP